MHRFADVHDTPDRTPSPLAICGVGSISHLLPFQRSANGSTGAVPVPLFPTATQALSEEHDTPHRTPPPVGLGVRWTDHLVPFHRSMNGRPRGAPWPTAVQARVDVHDTPNSTAPPAGLGVGWIDHLLPFQRTASVCCPSAPAGLKLPTAMHALAEVHETPLRPLPLAGVGVRWIAQRAPFHRSASVLFPLPLPPTAVQAFADLHDTPAR